MDPNLVVYGTSNVRVVDTSVYPIVPAAHLQAVVYAVAEKVSVDILSLTSNNVDFGHRLQTLSRALARPAYNQQHLPKPQEAS